MANWTPPPNSQQGPDPQNGGGGQQPGIYDPFQYQQPPAGGQQEQTSLGTPLVQPAQGVQTPPPFHGAQTPPPFQGAQPPFQGQHTAPPFQPQQPYGQPQFPAPPPGGPNQAVKVIGSVMAVVVLLGGGIGWKILKKAGKKTRNTTITLPQQRPQATIPVPSIRVPSLEPPAPSASPKPPTTARTTVPDIFSPTFKTAFKTSFRRVGNPVTRTCRNQSVKGTSKTAFLAVLAKYPCVGNLRGAMYTNAQKSVLITVLIMPMASATAANAVKRSGKYPLLLPPPKGSGFPQLRGSFTMWPKVYTTGNFVVFSMGQRPDGKKAGGSVANKSALHMGAEAASVLLFK